jgi:hypothetical protein
MDYHTAHLVMVLTVKFVKFAQLVDIKMVYTATFALLVLTAQLLVLSHQPIVLLEHTPTSLVQHLMQHAHSALLVAIKHLMVNHPALNAVLVLQIQILVQLWQLLA